MNEGESVIEARGALVRPMRMPAGFVVPRARLWLDRNAARFMRLFAIASGLVLFLMILGLYLKARPLLTSHSMVGLLTSSSWQPLRGEFGLLPFIMGTLWVTSVAVVIAVPLSLLTAIYLSEYSHRHLREKVKPLIDLLAGIPSVVYGLWGVLIIVPFVKDLVSPFFGTSSTGYSVLAAGLVLAIMISPIVIHVSMDVMRSVPTDLREASLALGATKWQTIKHVVLRRALPGIIAAVVLGLSRAFGETMAVLMVAGNVAISPSSLLDPSYPLPALIANNYGEMMSIPLYDSALLLSSLVLLLVVVFFNVIARSAMIGIERKVC